MKNENRISLRFKTDVFQRLNLKRAEEGTSFQEVGERFFLEWLEGKKRAPEHGFADISKDEERMLAGVLNFLRHHPDAQMVGMIRGLLESAARWKPKT